MCIENITPSDVLGSVIFNTFFEICSAWGCVGLSLGSTKVAHSTSRGACGSGGGACGGGACSGTWHTAAPAGNASLSAPEPSPPNLCAP